jgi:hypothetical protein
VIASRRVRPRMRDRPRRLVELALAAALVVPRAVLAQPAAPSGPDAAGSWEGWAKLTNDWPGQMCRYDGGPASTSVRLELTVVEGELKGSVAIDLPAEPSSGCPPLRKRYAIAGATQGAGTVSFTDAGGNEWTLALRRSNAVLQGLLAWRQGGREEPLAAGFTRPDGLRPTARLNGEVRLQRGGEGAVAEEPAATLTPAAGGGAAAPSTGVGRHAGNLGRVVGANVVGLGLLYGVNKLGKGSSESGVVTCSPRVCITGPTINDPCFCEGNVVSGVSCGTTTAGAPMGAPCDGKSVPCQADLSCNSGFCEDRFGRCPY